MTAPAFRILLIADASIGTALTERVQQALGGAPEGFVGVQLRAKSIPAIEALRLAHELRHITRKAHAPLSVNDRIDIAKLVAADGAHSPGGGLAPADIRALIGRKTCVGVSCHTLEEARRATMFGADYVTLAPVFPTPGKGEPLGIERFGEIVRSSKARAFALGGITPENARSVVDAGAAGVAVIRSVLDAADPTQAMRALVAACS